MRRSLPPCGRTALAAAVLVLAWPGLLAARQIELFDIYKGNLGVAIEGSGPLRGTGTDIDGESFAVTTLPVLAGFPRQEGNVAVRIVSALLYYQQQEETPLSSSSYGFVSSGGGPAVGFLSKQIGGDTTPCWSNGGSTGSASGSKTVRNYRADMRPFLFDDDGNIVSNLTFMLRDDGGTGNSTPKVEGATLVVVYAHPAIPFNVVVVNDGSGTMNNATDSVELEIEGFYQAVGGPGSTQLIPIVGNGQAGFSEKLYVNGVEIADNPFVNGWDDMPYPIGNLVAANDDSVTVAIDHVGNPFDCLNPTAFLLQAAVVDIDADGLIDATETGPYTDVETGQTVDLSDLGAVVGQKDLFVEIDHMVEFANDAYGTPHSHQLDQFAIDIVGDAFLNAPQSIRLHIDAGCDHGYTGSDYVIPDPQPGPGCGLRGGQAINERLPAFFCDTFVPGVGMPGDMLYSPAQCLYPNEPGGLSWKKGFRQTKNLFFHDSDAVTGALLNHSWRDGIFHYGVMAHYLAFPTPAELEVGPPYDLSDAPLVPFTPSTRSGVALLPGSDFAITLGEWPDTHPLDGLVGTREQQASALMHELAHNLYGFHGGITREAPFGTDDPSTPGNPLLDFIVPQPRNCNPNRPSVLNYMYGMLGLRTASGGFAIDLSDQIIEAPLGAQDEAGLDEFQGLGGGTTPYRIRWYAPAANVAALLGVTDLLADDTRCTDHSETVVGEAPVVRVESLGVARAPIDWDYDGDIDLSDVPPQDINFDGTPLFATPGQTTAQFRGFDDWDSIENVLHGLQQVGMTGNLYGFSMGITGEDLVTSGDFDLGDFDLGDFDLGDFDLGDFDLGDFDLGDFDLGDFDLGDFVGFLMAQGGDFDLGDFDLGDFDLGDNFGDFDLGDFDLGDFDLGETEEFTPDDQDGTSPYGLTTQVLRGRGGPRVLLQWQAPTGGPDVLVEYEIYFKDGAELGALSLLATVPAGQTSYEDSTVNVNNDVVTYAVRARYFDGTAGNFSNFVTLNGETVN